MAKIVYKTKEDGQAVNLRFAPDDYQRLAGEITIIGDVLPDINTLHSPSYIAAVEKEMVNDATKKQLADIDLKSIRSLREWLASQPDAPQWLIDHETEAQTERAKLIELKRRTVFQGAPPPQTTCYKHATG